MVVPPLLFILILSFQQFQFLNGAIKIYLPDSDIYNPRNWEKKDEKCEGIIFGDINEISIDVGNLFTSKLVLPTHGQIEFNKITFGKKSECIHLKSFVKHSSNDPNCYEIQNETTNVAIPHTERVPCYYDSVLYKRNSDYSPGWFGHSTEKGYGMMLWVNSQSCEDETGCLCGNEEADVCMFVDDETNLNCLNPIVPIGFCSHICGAQILLRQKGNFNLKRVEKALKNYKDIDTHVSKVINHGQVYIQAVFAEKSFTGSSLLSAKQFYDKLSESNYGVERIELKLSGSYYVKGQAGSTVNLVFGTLGGVLLLFGAIIAFYHTGLAESDIFKRISLSTNQMPRLNEFFSGARYNRQGSNISLGSSVSSLEKSFDNPMFGKTDYGTTAQENPASTSEITHENPMYEASEKTQKLQGILEEEQIEDL